MARLRSVAVLMLIAPLLLCGTACRKRAKNLVVLLPQENEKTSGIVVQNAAGSQTLTQPYEAVRVGRANSAPTKPFNLDPAEVRRIFGPTLDVLPAPEVVFTLYFDEGRDVLNDKSMAQLPEILKTIRERHSTLVSITGHTDTTGTPEDNYQLGLRRAKSVADVLQADGLNPSQMLIESHGDADLLIKTPRGVAEERNRRVEVIVR